jgi:hypothetical protein
MPSLLEEISPAYYGSDFVRLTLSNPTQRLQAFTPITITVDYSRCLPAGIVLPLEFSVTGPSSTSNRQRVFRRFLPRELSFVPREGGSFLVRLAESWHNLYFGVLVLEIAGDRLEG